MVHRELHLRLKRIRSSLPSRRFVSQSLEIEETVRKPFLKRSRQGESRKGPATVKERACKDEKIERTRP
jgi:hypothetical protein